MPNTVDASTIKRLDNIFSKNQWPIIDSGPLGEGNLFDEFCELLSFLNDEERELVLQLTENFKRYTLVDYPILCDNVFKKIDKNFLQSKKNIYVIPLNSPKDVLRGKIKSGGNVAYLLKDPILPRYLIRSKQHIIDVADVIKLHELYANRKDSLIIFFDDFIGTGQTALEVIEYYNNNTKIEQESILVASLVALKSGYDSIADMGVNVAADIIMLVDSEKAHI
jgi:hypothetical protein